MKYRLVLYWLFTGLGCSVLFAQEHGVETITIADLRQHLEFLASEKMQGRGDGKPGLDSAARYLTTRIGDIGLIPVDENMDYIQDYTLYKNTYSRDKNKISISYRGHEQVIGNRDFYMIVPQNPESMHLKGEIVFAGYGIKSEENHYDDFENVNVKGKIVLIMDRAPTSEDGSSCLFEDIGCHSLQNLFYKYFQILMLQPKAILVVLDPKSGHSSLGDIDPSLPGMISTFYSYEAPSETDEDQTGEKMKVILIHRDIADKILEGTGYTLPGLQEMIDRELKPHSFPVRNKTISIDLEMSHDKIIMPNVAGLVRGSDPVLGNEVLVLMAHFDHIGTDSSGKIYRGADDNASGSVALLEMAKAFMQENHKPGRSILFLWVSGEEIGLFGSRYYTAHPLLPLNNTIAAINLDMVGRTKTPADTGIIMNDSVNVLGADTLGVIGGHQSRELLHIADSFARNCHIVPDYNYNDINHPQKLYYRSDHFSFVVHDIPVLFFSTGIHRDYHQLTDTPEKIDYERLEKVCRFVYLLSYSLADRKERIVVDHPYSTW